MIYGEFCAFLGSFLPFFRHIWHVYLLPIWQTLSANGATILCKRQEAAPSRLLFVGLGPQKRSLAAGAGAVAPVFSWFSPSPPLNGLFAFVLQVLPVLISASVRPHLVHLSPACSPPPPWGAFNWGAGEWGPTPL